jgi:hypothetical protein
VLRPGPVLAASHLVFFSFLSFFSSAPGHTLFQIEFFDPSPLFFAKEVCERIDS